MREIKLKMWHNKKMFYDIINVYECLMQQLEFNKSQYSTGKTIEYDHAGLHGAVWLEYTGLKDINGKEICEGDIRRFEGGIGIIVWSDAAFAIKSPGSNAVDWEHSSVFIDSEFLGTIYENPELLEEVNK